MTMNFGSRVRQICAIKWMNLARRMNANQRHVARENRRGFFGFGQRNFHFFARLTQSCHIFGLRFYQFARAGVIQQRLRRDFRLVM